MATSTPVQPAYLYCRTADSITAPLVSNTYPDGGFILGYVPPSTDAAVPQGFRPGYWTLNFKYISAVWGGPATGAGSPNWPITVYLDWQLTDCNNISSNKKSSRVGSSVNGQTLIKVELKNLSAPALVDVQAQFSFNSASFNTSTLSYNNPPSVTVPSSGISTGGLLALSGKN
tara:strand:+ start:14 stop:532 length:519 start_codon:yes stop_codon:yes gene_type:complete